jgi:hypothetical protein
MGAQPAGISQRQKLRAAAFDGIRVWLCYGVVEYAFGTLRMVLFRDHITITWDQWRYP